LRLSDTGLQKAVSTLHIRSQVSSIQEIWSKLCGLEEVLPLDAVVFLGEKEMRARRDLALLGPQASLRVVGARQAHLCQLPRVLLRIREDVMADLVEGALGGVRVESEVGIGQESRLFYLGRPVQRLL